MGQYLQLAQKVQRPVTTPDTLQPARPSHGECNVPMPGAHIGWIRQDGTQATGIVDQVYIDEAPIVWVFVTHADCAWSVLNPRTVKLWVLNNPIDLTDGADGNQKGMLA